MHIHAARLRHTLLGRPRIWADPETTLYAADGTAPVVDAVNDSFYAEVHLEQPLTDGPAIDMSTLVKETSARLQLMMVGDMPAALEKFALDAEGTAHTDAELNAARAAKLAGQLELALRELCHGTLNRGARRGALDARATSREQVEANVAQCKPVPIGTAAPIEHLAVTLSRMAAVADSAAVLQPAVGGAQSSTASAAASSLAAGGLPGFLTMGSMAAAAQVSVFQRLTACVRSADSGVSSPLAAQQPVSVPQPLSLIAALDAAASRYSDLLAHSQVDPSSANAAGAARGDVAGAAAAAAGSAL